MNHNLHVQSRHVKDIMNKEVVYVDIADTVHEALNLMVENRVAALPVLNGKGHCVGMLSTSDLMDVALEVNEDLLHLDETTILRSGWLVEKLLRDFGESDIKELMTINVETISPEVSVEHAACEMMRHQVHRLPVVDHQGHLLGIVSTMDILAVVAEDGPGD
jgi:CBS domain-containing protein